MALRNIKAFNNTFDIQVKREKDMLSIKVFSKDKVYIETLIEKNETIKVTL
jgi:hypothetical protein